jgi:hypothetical protein
MNDTSAIENGKRDYRKVAARADTRPRSGAARAQAARRNAEAKIASDNAACWSPEIGRRLSSARTPVLVGALSITQTLIVAIEMVRAASAGGPPFGSRTAFSRAYARCIEPETLSGALRRF